jgi:hypothetical protein
MVKYPGEREVEEVTTGANDVVKRISADECCRVQNSGVLVGAVRIEPTAL